MIVGVSSDQCALDKGKKTYYDLSKRMEMVADLRFVDLVIPEYDMHQKVNDVIQYEVNLFVLGSDYREIFCKMEEYPFLRDHCEIAFLERTPDISSSLLRSKIKNHNK